MAIQESDIRIELTGYSGKRYIASLDGQEFSEVYSRLEDYAEKSLIKKIKSIPQKPKRLIEKRQGIIFAHINNHFELEIILTGIAIFKRKSINQI